MRENDCRIRQYRRHYRAGNDRKRGCQQRLSWSIEAGGAHARHGRANTLSSTSITTSTLSNTMDGGPGASTKDLTWENVGLAFSFILFDALCSKFFGLGIGTSLVTAAVRCVVQLTLVALILQKVFDANHPWAVAGIACPFQRSF